MPSHRPFSFCPDLGASFWPCIAIVGCFLVRSKIWQSQLRNCTHNMSFDLQSNFCKDNLRHQWGLVRQTDCRSAGPRLRSGCALFRTAFMGDLSLACIRAHFASFCDCKTKNTTARGFEPLPAEPNGFLVHHLNHSVTLS